MQTLTIDNKKKKVNFNDQNKNMVYLIRFVFGLNLLNAAIFFVLFNNQDDIIKWLWLGFAVMNLLLFYFSLTRLSVADHLNFDEIDDMKRNTVFGILFQLKNGKYRKVFIPRNSEQADKLLGYFRKSTD